MVGCATLASDAGDLDAERPNSHAGPFRALRNDEVPSQDGPYLLKGKLPRFRDATVLDIERTGSPGTTAMYALATLASQVGVFRFLCDDARSFPEKSDPAAPVLVASEAWEGVGLEAPDVAEVEGEIWLYYSAEGGVGAATSSDGVGFSKLPGPLLAAATEGWDAGLVPRAPSVVKVGSEYRMFYEAGGRIGEARSADGKAWERVAEPVLLPVPLDPDEPAFDSASVGDPEAWRAPNAEGKMITRVYYTGRTAEGTSAIGMAARFGSSGALTRAVAPSFSGQRAPFAPAILAFDRFTLLYLTERAGLTDDTDFPAVAAAVAPGNVTF
jgi:hypothetical protein